VAVPRALREKQAKSGHPSRWLRGLREVAIVLAIYVAYSAVRSLSGDEVASAVASAEEIVRWQERWGLDWEISIHSWTIDRSPLVHVANFIYFWFHLPLLPVFAVWMFWRDERSFGFLRLVWLISQVIGIAFFYFYPVAPPRLLPPGFGFFDTLAQNGLVDYQQAELGLLMNKYAAFPSLHFAWSFIIAAGLYQTLPWLWARRLALLFPLASFWSIVATGNHYVADALAGGVVVAFAFLMAFGAERLLQQRGVLQQDREPATIA
jgi:membrane-associated phospholipid phosphatase